MATSVLVIHPQAAVHGAARKMLEPAGFSVSQAGELRLADLGSPDVMLIDWRLLAPASESLQWLRSQAPTRGARIIVLVDRDELPSAIGALEHGADDCAGLPLAGQELLVRVKSSLRRPPATANADRLRAGPIVLDRQVHQVLIDDASVDLAPTEFRLLAFLLEHQGRVFGREELISRAWSSHVKAGHRTVDVHVRRLRQQLERFGCADMLQTVRGFGYRLRADD